MPVDPVSLPKARIERAPRWYLKDEDFLAAIGAALLLFSLMLMLGVIGQRCSTEISPDATATNLFALMGSFMFLLAATTLAMGIERLLNPEDKPETLLNTFGVRIAVAGLSIGIVAAANYGITLMILPVQTSFAAIAMCGGVTFSVMLSTIKNGKR